MSIQKKKWVSLHSLTTSREFEHKTRICLEDLILSVSMGMLSYGTISVSRHTLPPEIELVPLCLSSRPLRIMPTTLCVHTISTSSASPCFMLPYPLHIVSTKEHHVCYVLTWGMWLWFLCLVLGCAMWYNPPAWQCCHCQSMSPSPVVQHFPSTCGTPFPTTIYPNQGTDSSHLKFCACLYSTFVALLAFSVNFQLLSIVKNTLCNS